MMRKALPQRRSVRLPNFDYRTNAAYFVTICTAGRRLWFVNDVVRRLVLDAWHDIPAHHPNVDLDAFVVMPNHVHGIIVIGPSFQTDARAQQAAPLPQLRPNVAAGSLGTIVRSFKSRVTKDLRSARNIDTGIWQRGYHERVVRNEAGLERVRQYIEGNPARWQFDPENSLGAPDAFEVEFSNWLSYGDEASALIMEPRR